jgi:sulfite exporter TauE/SafE
MLFVIGLITSFHCIAMCGGINLSQTIKRNKREPQLAHNASPVKGSRLPAGAEGAGAESAAANGSKFSPRTFLNAALYNLGRVASYAIVGGLVGAIGSVFDFSNSGEAIIKLIAGLFMVIMALNMLGIFPVLRYLQPRLPRGLAAKLDGKLGSAGSPLIVGLLNGLMPCGPLQAMQIYALGTGSALLGALSMLVFALGTVPLVFAFGAAGSMLGSKFGKKVIKVGAAFVLILGVSMLMQSWNLSGLGNQLASQTRVSQSSDLPAPVIEGGVQVVKSKLSSGGYPEIAVKEGMPVRWTIEAKEGDINGCNYKMFIDEYGIEHEFTPGENIIEFTPERDGAIVYTCWMGMIRGLIIVEEEK